MPTTSTSTRINAFVVFVSNVALATSGVACLSFGVWTLWHDGDLPAIGTSLTAGLIFLFASSIERFESLKGLGVEAKTRKLDEAIDKANATLDQLRELAELSSESVVTLNSKVGRWDSAPSTRDAYEAVQRVRINLKSLGSPESTILRIMEPWVRVTTLDVVLLLLAELRKPLELVRQSLDERLRSYPTPFLAGDPAYVALFDERTRLGGFEGRYLGDPSLWKVGTHAERLANYVRDMPAIDEVARASLRSIISEWLPRLDYLAKNSDLSDKESWFKVTDSQPPSIA